MGLLSNLRVLCGSDIGDQVRDLKKQVTQLVTEVEDALALSEQRYRRLSKRLRDDPGGNGHAATPATENSRVDRLVARRAARSARVASG